MTNSVAIATPAARPTLRRARPAPLEARDQQVHEALGWPAPPVLVAGLLGVAMLAGFVAWERRVAHPLLDVTLFRNALALPT